MDNFVNDVNTFFNFLPTGISTIATVIAAASSIVAITPTPRDDKIVGQLYKVLEIIALNIGHAKQTAPNRSGGRFVAN